MFVFGATNDPHPSFGQTALTSVSNGKYGYASFFSVQRLQAAWMGNSKPCRLRKICPGARSEQDIGDAKTLELVLSHGADPTVVDGDGRTALHCACASGSTVTLDCAELVFHYTGIAA